MTRRSGQTGTIEETSGGRFRVRVQIDGQRVTVTPRGGVSSRAIAQQYLDGLQDESEAVAKEHEMTVEEFSKRFMTRRHRNVRASTMKRDRRAMVEIVEAFDGAPIATVDAPQVASIRNRWIDAGLADQTIRNRLNLMRVMFREAADLGLVEANPVADVKLGRRRRRKDRTLEIKQSVLLPHEQQKILNGFFGNHYLAHVAFSMFTGLRMSELYWLKWSDIDGEHVTVQRSEDGDLPKGDRARRVRMLDGARTAFELARGMHETWVFPSLRGHQLGHNKPPRDWRRLCIASIGRYVRWHGLRHTFGTSLAAGWWGRVWSLEEIRGLMGHRNVATTEIYAEIVSDLGGRAVGETNDAQAMPTVPVSKKKKTSKKESGANNRNRTGDLRFTNLRGSVAESDGCDSQEPTAGQRLARRIKGLSEEQAGPGLAICRALDAALAGDPDGCVEELAAVARKAVGE